MSEKTERIYIVPFRKAIIVPRNRRANKAIKILKEFAKRHMKSDEIIVSTKINEIIWENGITNIPKKIEVKMTKDKDGVVSIKLPTEKEEVVTEKEEVVTEKEEVVTEKEEV